MYMDEELKQLHINAALKAGEERSCGKKIDYKSEETASKAAVSINKKGKARNELEPYPCPFCNGWHIGKVMPKDILEKFLEDSGS